MANTKHSVAREIIIDRLLRERCGYCVKEILEKVNEGLMLQELAPVSINTIRNDIENIQSLYKKVLTSEKRGRDWYYKYKDSENTIFTNVLTFGELQLIQSALTSIRYIDDMEGTMMYKELPERVARILGLESDDNPVVIYENPPSLNCLKRFRILYEYILKKKPACITYCSNKSKSKQNVIVHPYFLLQRNGEWFLLCHDDKNDCAAEIPLSNIKQIDFADGKEFIPNEDFDFKDYYAKLSSVA